MPQIRLLQKHVAAEKCKDVLFQSLSTVIDIAYIYIERHLGNLTSTPGILHEYNYFSHSKSLSAIALRDRACAE